MFRAYLAAGSHDAARKREHDAADLSHRLDRRFRRGQGGVLIHRQDQEVAATDRLLHTELLLHQKLAFHHRDAPIAAAVEELARLKAIAEMAQGPADDHLLGGLRQAVEAGRRGTRENRLADSVDEPAAEALGVEAKQQHAHARPAVRSFLGQEFGLDARLDLATND